MSTELNGPIDSVGKLAVELDGEGPAVLVIGGLGATSAAFQIQTEALAQRFRVIRPDLEGAGRTPLTGPLSIDGYVSDMIGLLDELHIPTAHLIGHSMGTVIARRIAAQHPDRVTSLTLLCAVGEPADGGAGLRIRAEAIRTDGVRAAATQILTIATSAATRRDKPVAAALVRSLMLSQDQEGYAQSYEALASAGRPDEIDPGIPLLLITGADDPIGPPAESQKIAATHGNAIVHIIDDCGHWPMLEAHETVTNDVSQFLEKA